MKIDLKKRGVYVFPTSPYRIMIKLYNTKNRFASPKEKNKIIIGAPGAGKTTHIIKLMHELSFDESMLLSFSTKVIKKIKQKHPKINAKTLHSFALNAFKNQNHKIITKKDKNIILSKILDSKCIFKIAQVSLEISNYKNGFSNLSKRCKEIYDAYQKEIAESLDYDDLILYAMNNINQIKSPKHIFVDEAQDLNALQIKFLKLLSEKGVQIIFIGDFKQAIYKWRGSINNEKILQRAFNAEISYLNINYRCTQEIQDAALKVVKSQDTITCKKNDQDSFVIQQVSEDKLMNHIIKSHKQGSTSALLVNTNKEVDRYKALNKKGIQVMTIHASKGLEFDSVYVLAEKNKFRKKYNEYYVAITRAKNKCVILYHVNITSEFYVFQKYEHEIALEREDKLCIPHKCHEFIESLNAKQLKISAYIFAINIFTAYIDKSYSPEIDNAEISLKKAYALGLKRFDRQTFSKIINIFENYGISLISQSRAEINLNISSSFIKRISYRKNRYSGYIMINKHDILNKKGNELSCYINKIMCQRHSKAITTIKKQKYQSTTLWYCKHMKKDALYYDKDSIVLITNNACKYKIKRILKIYNNTNNIYKTKDLILK